MDHVNDTVNDPVSDNENAVTQSRIEAEHAEDRRVDGWSIVVIFTVLTLFAVHFISGWTFDF